MADQPASEKVLPPSPRKLQQARERGNVARSADLNSGVLLLVACLALYMLGPLIFNQLIGLTRYYFADASTISLDPGDMQPLLAQALLLTFPVVIPFMLVLMATGILINVTQIGFIFSSQALQPKLERLNPIRGFRRFVSLRALVELVKSLTKLGVIGYIAYSTVRGRIPDILALMHSSPWAVGVSVWHVLFAVWWRVALAMIIIGLFDFAFQRWQYLQDLRMTRQEAQDELKQLEGDLRIKLGPPIDARIIISSSRLDLDKLLAADEAGTAAETAEAPAPGGQPAATKAYTEGIKAISATAATAVFSAVGGLADTHICPIPCPVPPHGPGMVVKGSASVLINNLPAARKDDKVMEACGGADPIAMGCTSVLIGDKGGGGGGGGGGAGGKSGGGAGKKGGVTAKTQDKSGEAGGPTSASIQSLGVTCECSNPDCAAAFKSAADDGTPLVDRDTHGCAGPPDVAERVVGPGEVWIEIELVGENDEGIPGERFTLKPPDGDEISGVLGADGRIRIDGLETPGPCHITFPDLDQGACEEIV